MPGGQSTGAVRLTVSDLFAESDLGLRLVSGGQGAGAAVSGVHISELPNPTRWLSPGDVLLTTGLGVRDDPDAQRTLVRRLAESGMVALGLALGIYFHDMPSAMSEEADRLSFPVFTVPYETPFKAVTSFVLDSLVSRNVYLLRRRLSVQAHLLEALLEDKGTDYLVSSLAVLLSATVVLFDGAGRVVAGSAKGVTLTEPEAQEVWQAYQPRLDDPSADVLRIHDVGSLRVVFRDVWSRGQVERVLAIVYPREELVPEFTGVIASYVQKLLQLDVARSRQAEQIWKRMRGGLLDDLVFGIGRPQDLRERAEYFGFDPEGDYALIVCDPLGFSRVRARHRMSETGLHDLKDELEDRAGLFFALRKAPILAMLRSDLIVVSAQMEPAAAADMRELLREMREWMLEGFSWLDFALGSSDFHRGTTSAPRAFAEAREAAQVAKLEPEQLRVRLFSDLGPTASFLFGLEKSRLGALAASGLAPLERHDRESNDSLVDTLRTYMLADRNVKEAAQELYIHPNTLRYRLRKAEALLGAPLDSTRVLADLYLAFRAEVIMRSMVPALVEQGVESKNSYELLAAEESGPVDSGFGNLLVGYPAVALPGELAAARRALEKAEGRPHESPGASEYHAASGD